MTFSETPAFRTVSPGREFINASRTRSRFSHFDFGRPAGGSYSGGSYDSAEFEGYEGSSFYGGSLNPAYLSAPRSMGVEVPGRAGQGGGNEGLSAGGGSRASALYYSLSGASSPGEPRSAFRTGFDSDAFDFPGRFQGLGPQAALGDPMAGGEVPVIPLPAAGWLLISGLGALGALRLRKRSAA